MNLFICTSIWFHLILSNVIKCQFNITVPWITCNKGGKNCDPNFLSHVFKTSEILGNIINSATW
jgi:hypothetical protein